MPGGLAQWWQQIIAVGARLPEPKGQESWLLDCLYRNQHTEYGRKYLFSKMQSQQDYCSSVPVIAYEQAAKWIQRVADGEQDVLFSGRARAVELTGGSSGGRKIIPYSDHSIVDFRQVLLPWLMRLIVQNVTNGSAYWSIGPVSREQSHTAGGIPIGMEDGAYLGADVIELMGKVAAVPAWVAAARDIEHWQQLTLYYLLRRVDLELISVWSPTFFLSLLHGLQQQSTELSRLLRLGVKETPANPYLPADRQALRRFEKYLDNEDPRMLWPALKLVSCWADGSSAFYFKQLQDKLYYAQFQPKGLLATEAVVTVPDEDGRCLLAEGSGFFEFIADDSFYLSHQLELGQNYELVITTSGGLYRYRTGDCVKCEGYKENVKGNTPVLRFMGRLGLVSDMVGEKLTEDFVTACLEGISGFRVLVPAPVETPGYVLVVDVAHDPMSDNICERLDQRLKNNPQYAYARSIGQLNKVTLLKARQPLQQYLNRLSTVEGRSLGDIKLHALLTDADWLQTFKVVGAGEETGV